MKVKRSIQNKIILLILVVIFFSSITIGGLGIASFADELEKSVISTMNLTCKEKAEELDNIIGRIEQSTDVMAVLASNHIKNFDDLKDESYRNEYIENMKLAGYDIAINTKGAIGIYLRLNPEIAGPTEGFYWLVSNETQKLELEKNTNITQFDKEDMENVGWYYIPVDAQRPVWLDPYENQNTKRTIVSYAMPIYKDDQLIGVVGMDIDWKYITDMVDEITVYESGYAFLVDENFDIEHSKEFQSDMNVAELNHELKQISKEELMRNEKVYVISLSGKDHTVAFSVLSNDKIMAIAAPNERINEDFYALVIRIIWIAVATGLIFIFITIQIARTIIRPLQELNKAALDIAKGNLDVELNICSKDEVGTLAQSFKDTAEQLKIKIDYINSLAYSDKLTGVKNNTAYLQKVAFLRNEIQKKRLDFCVFVIDINGLKYINDNYGHEIGNELIIKVTQMISEVFGEENIYRIGGDEFVVLLQEQTKEESENNCKKFYDVLKKQKGKIWASASIGYAIYNKKLDATYESVFNRADEDMYDKKVHMKEIGENSRVIEKQKNTRREE